MFKPYGMSGIWRRLMFSIFSRIGLTYAKPSSRDDVLRFFQKIYPLNCGYDLQRCGNYLIPKDLTGIEVVFSPGVGLSSDFEFYFAELGVQCFLADASVSGPALDHANFSFIKKYIGSKTAGEFVSLDDWVNDLYPKGSDGILQMDIEGHEFSTILSSSDEVLNRFRIILLEVHCLNILNTNEGLLLCSLLIDKLLKNFKVCHFHVNNGLKPLNLDGLKFPGVIELTLIRSDRCKIHQDVEELPHALDIHNPRKRVPSFYTNFDNGVIR